MEPFPNISNISEAQWIHRAQWHIIYTFGATPSSCPGPWASSLNWFIPAVIERQAYTSLGRLECFHNFNFSLLVGDTNENEMSHPQFSSCKCLGVFSLALLGHTRTHPSLPRRHSLSDMLLGRDMAENTYSSRCYCSLSNLYSGYSSIFQYSRAGKVYFIQHNSYGWTRDRLHILR